MITASTATPRTDRPDRCSVPDPFIRLSNRLRLTLEAIATSMDALAEANPDHLALICEKADAIDNRAMELAYPLEEASGELRLAWLSGELVDVAGDAVPAAAPATAATDEHAQWTYMTAALSALQTARTLVGSAGLAALTESIAGAMRELVEAQRELSRKLTPAADADAKAETQVA